MVTCMNCALHDRRAPSTALLFTETGDTYRRGLCTRYVLRLAQCSVLATSPPPPPTPTLSFIFPSLRLPLSLSLRLPPPPLSLLSLSPSISPPLLSLSLSFSLPPLCLLPLSLSPPPPLSLALSLTDWPDHFNASLVISSRGRHAPLPNRPDEVAVCRGNRYEQTQQSQPAAPSHASK